MKKIILAVSIFGIFMSSNAQENTQAVNIENNTIRNNELKVNALFLVVGSVNFTYERLLSQESGLGLEVFLPFDEEIKDDIKYYISPYYRFYFGNKYASGFFLEGFGMLSEVRVNEIIYFNNNANITDIEYVDETNFALGIGLGGKWITNGGFIGELSLGIGRNLLSSDYDNEFVGKIGVTLGYRF